jgi:hypothetical protein
VIDFDAHDYRQFIGCQRIYARDLNRFDSAEGGAHLGTLKILE